MTIPRLVLTWVEMVSDDAGFDPWELIEIEPEEWGE